MLLGCHPPLQKTTRIVTFFDRRRGLRGTSYVVQNACWVSRNCCVKGLNSHCFHRGWSTHQANKYYSLYSLYTHIIRIFSSSGLYNQTISFIATFDDGTHDYKTRCLILHMAYLVATFGKGPMQMYVFDLLG